MARLGFGELIFLVCFGHVYVEDVFGAFGAGPDAGHVDVFGVEVEVGVARNLYTNFFSRLTFRFLNSHL